MISIVLASTSRYRRELLGRLRLPFAVESPGVDETARAGERPAETARRLALAKAAAVLSRHPGAIVIGSDQVAELDGRSIGKPGDHAAAAEQLANLQGRSAIFHTALAVVGAGGPPSVDCVETVVRLRPLSAAAILAYLAAEPAYDCAGSAKIESLGIALMEAVSSEDPTALVGLPLIRLTTRLAERGVHVLPD
jgi:septum formation protein